ncbi:hypothetical protein I4U23_004691 [Adineta vaga]|nr:hypothetical protein I4U23_004691 [Adineta vaga]
MEYTANASSQFQLLAILCQQSQQTIDDALQILFQTKLVSSQVIFSQSFQIQVNLFFETWKLTTINTFLMTIQLIRANNQGNQLISYMNSHIDLYSIPTNFKIKASCHSPMGIYDYNMNSSTSIRIYTIPNFFVGCFQLESLLLSTLECSYHISCMLKIYSYHITTLQPFNF